MDPATADRAFGWLFTRNYRTFLCADLDEASSRLLVEDGDKRRPADYYRRQLFLRVPLDVVGDLRSSILDDKLNLPQWDAVVAGWRVRRSPMFLLVRDLWRGAEDVRRRLNATEEALKPSILHLTQCLALTGRADRIFADEPSGLGVSPTRVSEIARGTDYYELLNACEDESRRRGVEREVKKRLREVETEERKQAREHRERRRQEFRELQSFKSYLQQDDFEPLNAREARALELYRFLYEKAGPFNWQAASDAFEDYVIKHVVRGEPDPEVGE